VIEAESNERSGGPPDPNEQLWPMGAVTRRTGIGEHTLRAWERRFGFPTPHRLPSGHRRYTPDQVRQLLLIQEALNYGYRAGDVVPLDRQRLEALLAEAGRGAADTEESSPAWLESVLSSGLAFDRDGLSGQLHQAAMMLGLSRWLRERVEPLLIEVGEAWARGELQIRHEHFVSEVLEDVLRSLRTPLEQGGAGRPIVLASLPEEQHTLGLQVAALSVAAVGRRLHILGPRSPVEEIAQAAVAVDAPAVGLSISLYAEPEATAAAVHELRALLPSRVRLWLGGAGAGQIEDVPVNTEVLEGLDDLDRAVKLLGD
jgi:DNA-binding transcriptional MerR regulator/methylmalonyl-CoA mutase cobalamin-binding subunit